jgi:hypothetical protein
VAGQAAAVAGIVERLMPDELFTEWTKARVWAKLYRLVLDRRGSRGDLDRSRCAIDSVNMRALKRGT